jgi:hypothetical protein
VAQAVNISEEARASSEKRLLSKLSFNIEFYRAEINFSRVLMYGMGGMLGGLGLLAGGGGLIVVGGMGVLLGSGVGSMGISAEHKLHKKLAQENDDWTAGELRDCFAKAQREAYFAQKRLIVQAADQYLASGKLISVEEAAWLATLDPSVLHEATDQLAITVLQIRKMLAHTRCTDFNSDGSKKADAPLTFEKMQFNSANPMHRTILHEKLLQNDAPVLEDGYPVIQEPEIVEQTVPKTSFSKSLRYFFGFSRKETVIREYIRDKLPRFKDVEVQRLRPVEDFAAALAQFEERNPALDLPAMRGWGRARKALPAPKGY